MSRILIGDFGKIVRLGLQELLDEEGMDIVADERPGGEIVQNVVAVLPDVVVLDLDAEENDAVAREIATGFPSVTVIACSSVEPVMRVFPRFHLGEYYETELSPAGFVDAVKRTG